MPPHQNSYASAACTLHPRIRARSRRCDASVGTPSGPPMSSNKWLLTFALLGLLIAGVASATEEKKSTETKTVKPSPASPSSTLSSKVVAHRDEIYIDDDAIEGSGGHSDLHDDLEKDPDYSGSGYGPDDEDSSTEHRQSHRRPNIQTQSGNSNHNTNDNDLITSRIHQTNSGTIIGSGTNSGNSGILSSSGGSGNTGLNTIGKDHHHTSSSSSEPTTATTVDNKNNNNPKHTSSSTSSLYPIQTHTSHSSPIFPSVDTHNTDEDDIDLDAHVETGSGDGGIIDPQRGSEDDDNTGDDDPDEEDEIIPRVSNFDVGSEKHNPAPVDGDHASIDADRKMHLNPYHHNTSEEDHKQTFGPAFGPAVDDFDDDDTQGNYEDKDDSEDAHEEDEDDGTEMYIDTTDPSSVGGGSSVGETTPKLPGINNQGTIHELDTNNINSLPPDTKVVEHTPGNEVHIMSENDRTTSFFAQPGILAAVIGGAVVGLLCAILVVMFIVYRMRKKDEGSYALDEPKRSPAVNSYAKNANNREFYA